MLTRIYMGVIGRIYAFGVRRSRARAIKLDKKRGVDFYTMVDNKGTPEAVEGSYNYEAIGFLYDFYLRKFLRRQDHTGDRIIDVGCGKGRALELFLSFGFSKADGLEYSPKLSEIARKNMRTLGLPCEIFTGDAAEFDGYDAYNWFYLYNPFNQNIMLSFIGRLKESLQRNPRVIKILYANPTCEKVFADAGFHMGVVNEGKEGVCRICLITNEGMPEDAADK